MAAKCEFVAEQSEGEEFWSVLAGGGLVYDATCEFTQEQAEWVAAKCNENPDGTWDDIHPEFEKLWPYVSQTQTAPVASEPAADDTVKDYVRARHLPTMDAGHALVERLQAELDAAYQSLADVVNQFDQELTGKQAELDKCRELKESAKAERDALAAALASLCGDMTHWLEDANNGMAAHVAWHIEQALAAVGSKPQE